MSGTFVLSVLDLMKNMKGFTFPFLYFAQTLEKPVTISQS